MQMPRLPAGFAAAERVNAHRMKPHAIGGKTLDQHIAARIVFSDIDTVLLHRRLKPHLVKHMVVRARDTQHAATVIGRSAAAIAITITTTTTTTIERRACGAGIVDGIEIGDRSNPRIGRVQARHHHIALGRGHDRRNTERVAQLTLDVETNHTNAHLIVGLSPAVPDFMGKCPLKTQWIGVAERRAARGRNRLPVAGERIARKPAEHKVRPREARCGNLILPDVVHHVQQQNVRDDDVLRVRVGRQRRTVIVPVARLIDRAQERIARAGFDHGRVGQAAARGVIHGDIGDLRHATAEKRLVEHRKRVVAVVAFNHGVERVDRHNKVDVRAFGREAEEIDGVVDVVAQRHIGRGDRAVGAIDGRLRDLDAVGIDAQQRVDAGLRRSNKRDLYSHHRGVTRDQRQTARRRLQSLRDLDRGHGKVDRHDH